MMEPPGVFTTPTIACPSCHHGIDPHGTNPGGPCDVGTYVHDGEEVSLCQCMWSPNDIAARLIAAARNDERDELAKKYGKGFLNLYQHCSCAQGMSYPGCPVHSKDWEQWTRADEREKIAADIESLREQLDIAVDERHYADMRAALRLRAKVEALHHDGLCSVTAQMGSCDCLRGEVLALIDGADHE